MAPPPQQCPKCREEMEKRATMHFGDDSGKPRPAGGLREFFSWRRAKRIWLCPNCGHEVPRKLGFFDTA